MTTTTNNHLTLIDQVGGIEKAKEIVGGAPEGATGINHVDDDEYNTYVITKPEWSVMNKHAYWHVDALTGSGRWESMANVFGGYDLLLGLIELNDLRTAIAQYDKTWVEKRFGIKKWYPIPEHHMCTDKQSDQEFKVGDLVVKTHPKNTILWPVLGVYKNGGVWLDYKGFCWKPPRVRHATPAEIKAGCRLDHSVDVTDTVTDIRNHISPRTVVWDLASGEDWSVNHG